MENVCFRTILARKIYGQPQVLTHRQLFPVSYFRSSILRLPNCMFSTENDSGGKDDSDNKTDNDQKTAVNKPKLSSKEKLNNLLESIVKESQERKKNTEQDKVNFKLAVPIREKTAKIIAKKMSQTDKTDIEPELSPNIISAVKSVAEKLDGDPQIRENELVQKLKSQQTEKIKLSELFHGMKIDNTRPVPSPGKPSGYEDSRAQRVRRILGEKDAKKERRLPKSDPIPRPIQMPTYVYTPIDLFGAKPVGIFTNKKKQSPPNTPTLSTWDRIHQKELKLAVTHPPVNAFQEMILWTQQGKLWHFPIDNEQGIGDEVKSDFSEHVFLEPVIEPWCPKSGPIRRLMELITVALSKNPYLTVTEKHEYLEWYHQYLKGKSDILKQVGVGEIQ